MKRVFPFATVFVILFACTSARSSTPVVDSVLVNDFVFDSSGTPWLDGWTLTPMGASDTQHFVPDVPPGSKAAWSVSLEPGWVFGGTNVVREFIGLPSGIYHVSLWGRSTSPGSNGWFALMQSDSTYSLYPPDRGVINDTVWRNYILTDTLTLSPNDTLRLQLDGGGSEIAFWHTFVNDISLVRLRPTSGITTPSIQPVALRISPDPFFLSTSIDVTTDVEGPAEICIVNPLGVTVGNVYSGNLSPGEHRVTWSAEGLPAGVYECVLRMSDRVQAVRMVVKQ